MREQKRYEEMLAGMSLSKEERKTRQKLQSCQSTGREKEEDQYKNRRTVYRKTRS